MTAEQLKQINQVRLALVGVASAESNSGSEKEWVEAIEALMVEDDILFDVALIRVAYGLGKADGLGA